MEFEPPRLLAAKVSEVVAWREESDFSIDIKNLLTRAADQILEADSGNLSIINGREVRASTPAEFTYEDHVASVSLEDAYGLSQANDGSVDYLGVGIRLLIPDLGMDQNIFVINKGSVKDHEGREVDRLLGLDPVISTMRFISEAQAQPASAFGIIDQISHH
jgi:hypothetical protein